MKNCRIISNISRGLILFALCSILGCLSISTRVMVLPDQDIVFQANDGENYQLGFVNEDGTDAVWFSTKIRITQPIWSLDKNAVFFRTIVREHPGIETQSRSGYIGVLKNNDIPKAACENSFSPTDRIVPTHEPNVILASEGDRLGFIDLSHCEWQKLIVTSKDGYCSYALSTDETTLLFSKFHANKCMIQGMNLETGDVHSYGEGRSAIFSPDDQRIAFTRPDGLFIMDRDGENIKELVHFRSVLRESRNYYEIPTMPAWSPDGNWLVYHKCVSDDGLCETTADFQIFKVRVADGYEVMIIENGLNPSWR